MKVEQIQIPKEEAEKQYNEYKQVIQKHKNEYVKDLKRIYGHMRHGRAIIDINKAMKIGDLNKDGDPKLAICRADAKICYFQKLTDGRGVFRMSRWGNRKTETIWVRIKDTWNWQTKPNQWNGVEIVNRHLETPLPIIPAHILKTINRNLRTYHILWEVEEWKPVPPRDPILLKRLTSNVFVVLVTWDLTPLERAVIQGRIG